MTRLALAVCLSCALVGSGCARFVKMRDPIYETVSPEPYRDTALAIKKNEEALHLIAHDHWEMAERSLKSALVADVDYGPAHNNLGWVYYKQGRYYLAAWEYEYAVKLMPNSADPLNNLGLVLEEVGRTSEAISYFEQAHGVEPRRTEFMANLSRARVRDEELTPEIAALLDEVAFRDQRPEWREWARQLLATRYREVHLACCSPAEMIWEHGQGEEVIEQLEQNEELQQSIPLSSLPPPHRTSVPTLKSNEEPAPPDLSLPPNSIPRN